MDDDYIKELTQEEKIVFVKLFCKQIQSDGMIETREINFLKLIASRYGLDSRIVVNIIKMAKDIDYIEEARKIHNRQHALELIKELCVLANIDEDLENNELNIIVDIARAMGIEDEKVILIHRWVLDSAIVAKTGQLIMERGNG